MIHGVVVGEIWATVKVPSLNGRKLLVVRPASQPGGPPLSTADIVAVDLAGAGKGDRVLVALGKAARNAAGDDHAALEAAIVGVVDDLAVDETVVAPPASDVSKPPRRKRTAAPKTKVGRETADLFLRDAAGAEEADESAVHPVTDSAPVISDPPPIDSMLEDAADEVQVVIDDGADARPADLPDFDAVEGVWDDEESEEK